MIGIARMGSTRLPGKVLKDLNGKPVLAWIKLAFLRSALLDDFVIATTTDPKDDEIVKWCESRSVRVYRGSEDDVLTRFTMAAVTAQADVAIRVTCDCPFIDPDIIDQIVALQQATGADYVSNIDPPTWPDGMDCEAITIDALKRTHEEARSKIDRECVTTYIYRNQHRFKCETLICPLPNMHKERWVLDTENDYEFCKQVAAHVNYGNWLLIKRFLDANPEVRAINAMHPRNERYYEALTNEPLSRRSYPASKQLLKRAEKTVPLAAQTFSKSKVQYPADSPLFVTHGDGAYCFDVDGNRYIDLVGGLLPVIMGHRDPDVDYAIRRQLNRGISLSLSTELEADLSELLCKHIPCAEMTRFGKNGTDVTSAAVRLARAYTGRDLVLSAGYHGWADWSVAQDPVRNVGVPNWIRHYTALRKDFYPKQLGTKQFACLVVEPDAEKDLGAMQFWCNQTGTLLVFDEIITWPRWGLSGAQGFYGVTPDLACISKAMANGMPISALVGKREYMAHMERTSYSGTFFGETLSIVAAIATIKKLEAEDVIGKIQANNRLINRELSGIFGRFNDSVDHAPVDILPSEHLTRLVFHNQSIKTLFIQEMAQNGVLIIASHNLSYAHGHNEIGRILKAYEATLDTIRDAMNKGDIDSRINQHSIPETANVRWRAS